MHYNEFCGMKQSLLWGYYQRARSILQNRAKLNGKKVIPDELFESTQTEKNDGNKPLSFMDSLKVMNA